MCILMEFALSIPNIMTFGLESYTLRIGKATRIG